MNQLTRDFIGLSVVAGLALIIAALFGELRGVLPVVVIFLLATYAKAIVTRFDLPDVIINFIPIGILVCFSGWLVLKGESSVVAIVAAFAGGWILNTTVQDVRGLLVDS